MDESLRHLRSGSHHPASSPTTLFVILCIVLILGETVITIFFREWLERFPPLGAGMVDALLLLSLLFPILYYLVLRPLKNSFALQLKAHQELAESRSTTCALMDSLTESAFLLKPDGTLITLNQTAAHRLGGSVEGMIGTSVYSYFSSGVAENRRQMVEQAAREKRPVRFQDRRDDRSFDVSITPIIGTSGEVTSLAVFAFDTTRYLDAERRMRENADSLERAINEIRLLGSMSETLQSCRTLDEAYGVLAKYANQLFPEDNGALYIMDAERHLLDLVSFWGDFWSQGDSITPDDCWGLRRGKMHVFKDSLKDVPCAHLCETGPYHYYCLPLIARSETMGMLHMRVTIPPDPSTAESTLRAKEQLLESMGEHMALAIANLSLREQLHTLSTRDPLTGVFNRRFMEETLLREVSQARRAKRPLGVIMLDIDHFKRFNDTFGHEVGDLLLKEVGKLLARETRGGDVVCRFGGEEFVLLLPGASLLDSGKKAEALRRSIEGLSIQHGDRLLSVTVSLGVTVWPDGGDDGETLLRSADQALYDAKESGRNLVAIARDIAPPVEFAS